MEVGVGTQQLPHYGISCSCQTFLKKFPCDSAPVSVALAKAVQEGYSLHVQISRPVQKVKPPSSGSLQVNLSMGNIVSPPPNSPEILQRV